jgi:hypothetical protein
LRITRKAKRIVFHLGKREKQLLWQILKLYPLITSANAPLSKLATGPEAEANQRLLEEALAEQRHQNKKQLLALLDDPARCKEDATGCQLSLLHGDLEWLLQVLNDVRVGSWIQLGSPEQINMVNMLNENTARHFWAMEIAGLFQQQFIEALDDVSG